MRLAALTISLLLAVGSQAAESDSLLQAARSGRIEHHLKEVVSSSNLNVRDAYGATPLMYSAAFGPLRDMRALIRAGADVNARTAAGSTALMWATGDPAKVQLLLDAGAEVNARRNDGATALLSTAFRENYAAFRILREAGADPGADMPLIPNAPIRANLQLLAYSTDEVTLRALLPAKPPLTVLTAIPGSSPFAGLFQMSGFSFRPRIVAGVAHGVQALLDLGADPNADVRQLARALPPVALAASFGDPDAVRALLNAGADPNRTGTLGLTPLMIAVAAEDPNLEVVQMLLNAGASLHARDQVGRTALDWALMQGDSPVAQLLLARSGGRGNWKPSTPDSVAQPRTLAGAVALSLDKLRTSERRFRESMGCISCHHQSLPSVAATIAARHGIGASSELRKQATEATLRMWAPSRENFLMGNCSVFGFLGNVSYGLFALSEEGVPPDAVTDAAAACLASLQWPDGRWEGGDMRPPLAGKTPFVYTALAIRALKSYLPPGRSEERQARISRALAYLRSGRPGDTQGHSFRLLGLIWGGGAASEIRQQARALAELQNRKGGWSQRTGMAPDAYATGQALFALRMSGMQPSNPVYLRGVRHLLHAQLPDGTWFLRSRTLGFQPYFETDFPHGRDQFISAAATAWASIALAHAL